MNRKSIIAMTGAALLGFAGLALHAAGTNPPPAGEPRFEGGPGPGGRGFAGDFMPPDLLGPGMLKRVADKLNLTQAQRDTIKGYLESARPNLQSLHEAMRTNNQRLMDIKPDAANYSAVVADVSQKSGELVGKIITDGSQLRAQIWKVLTPEQRTKLQEMQATFREHAQERRQGRRPHGPKDGGPDAN